MSSKQFINKLMAATGSRNHQALFISTGLSPGRISMLVSGKADNISIKGFIRISEASGIKVSTLAGWWVGEDI